MSDPSNSSSSSRQSALPPLAPSFTAPGLSAETSAAMAQRGTPATLNLDDIFGDVLFTPGGDTLLLSEQEGRVLPSGEVQVAPVASRPQGDHFVNVPQAGGIQTTNLDKPGQRALAMGQAANATTTTNMTAAAAAASPSVPFQQPPQQKHHLQFAITPMVAAAAAAQQPTKTSRPGRKTSEQQKNARRERNREHAKRSRVRKKFLLESLQHSVSILREENDKLRNAISSQLGDTEADKLIKEQLDSGGDVSLIASSASDANKVLDDPDFSFIKALQTAQQNFVVTDPSLPDNPIVYASQGFLNLTGYTLDQVLGRNCRFLQGPDTDPRSVEKIRKSIEEGTDASVCLLNYRVDGTTFWNQFFIAALRDADGNVTNYVGVQCKVSDQYAASVLEKQAEQAAVTATKGAIDTRKEAKTEAS